MKIKTILIFIFIPLLCYSQPIQNFGLGLGIYNVEPILLLDDLGNNEKFAGAMDIQFLNISYEPRFTLVDSFLNEFSVSIGVPAGIGISQYVDNKVNIFGYGSAHISTIGYLNWGNGSLKNNMYNRTLGFSLGFGFTYLRSGIIKQKTDVTRPKNGLIKPVFSCSFRYRTNQNMIWGLNIIWRLKKEYSFERCYFPDPSYLYPVCNDVTYNEDGFLLQLKVFFGR